MTHIITIFSRCLWLASGILASIQVHATHLREEPGNCSDQFLKTAPQQVLPCYLARADEHYQWQLESTSEARIEVDAKSILVKVYSLLMDSQRWPLDKQHKVDHWIWQHRMTIYQPESVTTDTALLYVNGGMQFSDKGEALSVNQSPNDDLNFTQIAAITNSVVVDLKDVPNQFLQFAGQKPLKEDALVAYTWNEFVKSPGKNYNLPLRLPMVKATQKAMDTTQTFMKEQKIKVKNFVLSGLSKRGWTVWLAGAMDRRVVAIAPMVIDILNLQPSMQHHFDSYGRWAPAVKDYKDLLPILHSPEISRLMKIIDPINYTDFLTMPKYIVTASADDFFLPDSSRYYFETLRGEKWLRTLPNLRHYIARMDREQVSNTLASFYGTVIDQRPMPSVYWEQENDTLSIKSSRPPKSVKLWTAYNPNNRDFRATPDNPGVEPFTATPVRMLCNSSCRLNVSIANTGKGWKASFLELSFSNKPYQDFVITTQTFITPDTYPDH